MDVINSSQSAYLILKDLMSFDAEEVWILALNTGLSVIEKKLLFRGTVDHCAVYPRDILRFICLHNASTFLMAHTHPSGNCEPSLEDLRATKSILRLSYLIEIPLTDHLILTSKGFVSLADLGYIKKFKPR